MAEIDVMALNQTVKEQNYFVTQMMNEMNKAVVGQREMIEGIVMGLLTGGHILLEGVPGLAKTLTIKSMAQAIHAQFSRIQFTPDLLPADVIGTMIYNQRKKDRSFQTSSWPTRSIVLLPKFNLHFLKPWLKNK